MGMSRDRNPTAATLNVPAGFEGLARIYFQKRKDEVPLLLQLLRERKFEELQVLGHNMKGAGASYGFADLTRFGARIEMFAREKNGLAIAEQLTALARYLQDCEAAVSKLE